MKATEQKPNLLMLAAKRKADALKAGSHLGQAGKNQSAKSRYIEKTQPFAPRGGRNAQGKP